MKTTILFISIILLASASLSGQNSKELRTWTQQDTLQLPGKNHPPEFNRKPRIYSDRENPGMEKFRRNLPPGHRKWSAQDSIAEQTYPGSSRFYAKSLAPYAYDHGYGKSFIIKPDTTSRQYLIIINPITGERRKY